MSDDEARLIQRAKEGDPSAFSEIYARCQPFIYRYIFYRVNDVATAEDLTSEVFVRLVEKIDRFSYRGRPILAWLYTIARNLISDYARHSQRRPTTVPLEEQLMTQLSNPGWSAEITLTQQMLATALSHLTEEQRQVIILRFVEGMNSKTVAQVMDKSLGAIKALQHRALVALRQILEQNGDQD
jgi:RNA polymerase sigma-70 factor (ECF subfamily)